MIKIVLACCLIVSVATSAVAIESDVYPYISATLGSALTSISKLSDSSGSFYTNFDPGYMAGAAAGIALDTYPGWNIERVRVEAEIGYRANKLSKLKNSQGQSANVAGTITVKNAMLNGYLDNTSLLTNEMPVNIFITAGMGVAMASISNISYLGTTLVKSANDTQLAYQIGLGAGYGLTKKITLDATYKYLGTAPFKFDGIKADYGSHNVLLGVRYAFK